MTAEEQRPESNSASEITTEIALARRKLMMALGSTGMLAGCLGEGAENEAPTPGDTATGTPTESPTPVESEAPEVPQTVTSPEGSVEIDVDLSDGRLAYTSRFEGETIIDGARIGRFEFRDQPVLETFEVTGIERDEHSSTWKPPAGKTDEVENEYRELTIGLQELDSPERRLTVIFRAFDYGYGFRYVFPEQSAMDSFEMLGEQTEYVFTDDHTAYFQWGNPVLFQNSYQERPLSQLPSANTPFVVDAGSTYCSVHEADLTDYASLQLVQSSDEHALESNLVPWPDFETKVKGEAPHASPWRTFRFGETPGALLETHLTENLCPPSEIDDPSWIEPGQFVGVWWEYHTGDASTHVESKRGPNLGPTTENAKQYVDLASEYDIPYVLVEGWNDAWEFYTPRSTFDYDEFVSYAKQKGTEFQPQLEIGNYGKKFISQMDTAFSMFQSSGISTIKTGYAGGAGSRTNGHFHQDQWMVNHYREVTETAAEYGLSLNVHEPIKPTGLRRTYPNLLTRECGKVAEIDGDGDGLPPEHHVDLALVRMVAGPIEYQPGIVNLDYKDVAAQSTLARQLAYYPTLFSPLQMLADYPEHYAEEPEAVEYMTSVPVIWDETNVVASQMKDYVAIARRKEDEWHVGVLTDEEGRSVDVDLDFLESGTTYHADIYADAEGASFEENPEAYVIDSYTVDSSDTIAASMVGGGGQAIRLRPGSSDAPAYRAPSYEYRSLEVPEEVQAGEDVTAAVTIRNAGNHLGGERVSLYVDGEAIVDEFVRVPGETTKTVTLSARVFQEGETEIGVGAESAKLSTQATIRHRDPELEYGEQTIPHNFFKIDEPVEVDVEAQNIGSKGLEHDFSLQVDGSVRNSKRMEFAPGQNQAVTLSDVVSEPGDHTVAIDDLDEQSVTVLEPLSDYAAVEGYETFTTRKTSAQFGAKGDEFVIDAAGGDTWEGQDDYAAIYEPDGFADGSTAIVRLEEQPEFTGWAKAGLMVRNDITGDGESQGYAMLTTLAGNSLAYLMRDGNGDGGIDSGLNADSEYDPPVWLRLSRDGKVLTGEIRKDGGEWELIGKITFGGATEMQDVGVFSATKETDQMGRAKFSQFTVE